MLPSPKYHFTIESQSDLLADMEVWDRALPGVFEPGHFHSYYEILIFKKGGGTHQMANDMFDVEDCSIHVLANNNFHELRRTTETDGFEIIFSEVFLHQLQQFDRKTNYIKYFSESHVLNLTPGTFGELQVYFDELVKDYDNKSLFHNLAALIIAKIISIDANTQPGPSNTGFDKALLALLGEHYKEKQSLEFYASKLNMSLNTFQRRTKAAFGKSVIELQNDRIVQEVKFLLSRSQRPIKEICSDFNFTDEAHFNHFFKKHIGISPSAFRLSSMV
jgi:AraC family transcriptional activator of pobA